MQLLSKIDLESSQTFVDRDGKTQHGVQVFNMLIDEV